MRKSYGEASRSAEEIRAVPDAGEVKDALRGQVG
jgi:hypothetical protein